MQWQLLYIHTRAKITPNRSSTSAPTILSVFFQTMGRKAWRSTDPHFIQRVPLLNSWKFAFPFQLKRPEEYLGNQKIAWGKKIILIAGGFKPSNPIKLVLKDLQQTSVLEIWFFFSFWVFRKGKQIQFFNQSFHKEIYNANVLKHKLIQWQTPFLLKCANKVDPFSRALFLGGFCNEFTSFTSTEPCSCGNHRAEYIHCFIWPSASGLNWDLGWWANDWTVMQKK